MGSAYIEICLESTPCIWM